MAWQRWQPAAALWRLHRSSVSAWVIKDCFITEAVRGCARGLSDLTLLWSGGCAGASKFVFMQARRSTRKRVMWGCLPRSEARTYNWFSAVFSAPELNVPRGSARCHVRQLCNPCARDAALPQLVDW